MNVRFAPEAADVRQIAGFPESGPEIHEAIRRIPLQRFPYFVFYAVDSDGPVVLGCLHAHRDPRTWPRRRPPR